MQGSSQLVKTLFDKLVDGGHVPRHDHPLGIAPRRTRHNAISQGSDFSN